MISLKAWRWRDIGLNILNDLGVWLYSPIKLVRGIIEKKSENTLTHTLKRNMPNMR